MFVNTKASEAIKSKDIYEKSIHKGKKVNIKKAIA